MASGGFLEQWGVSAPSEAVLSSEQGQNFRKSFLEKMNPIRDDLNVLRSNAPYNVSNHYTGNVDILFGNYNKIMKAIDPAYPEKQKPNIEKTLATLKKLKADINGKQKEAVAAHKAWEDLTPVLEQTSDRLNDMEIWGYGSAVKLSSAMLAIETAYQERRYADAVTALNQLTANLEPYYEDFVLQSNAQPHYEKTRGLFDERLVDAEEFDSKTSEMEGLLDQINTQAKSISELAAKNRFKEALDLLSEAMKLVTAFEAAMPEEVRPTRYFDVTANGKTYRLSEAAFQEAQRQALEELRKMAELMRSSHEHLVEIEDDLRGTAELQNALITAFWGVATFAVDKIDSPSLTARVQSEAALQVLEKTIESENLSAIDDATKRAHLALAAYDEAVGLFQEKFFEIGQKNVDNWKLAQSVYNAAFEVVLTAIVTAYSGGNKYIGSAVGKAGAQTLESLPAELVPHLMGTSKKTVARSIRDVHIDVLVAGATGAASTGIGKLGDSGLGLIASKTGLAKLAGKSKAVAIVGEYLSSALKEGGSKSLEELLKAGANYVKSNGKAPTEKEIEKMKYNVVEGVVVGLIGDLVKNFDGALTSHVKDRVPQQIVEQGTKHHDKTKLSLTNEEHDKLIGEVQGKSNEFLLKKFYKVAWDKVTADPEKLKVPEQVISEINAQIMADRYVDDVFEEALKTVIAKREG